MATPRLMLNYRWETISHIRFGKYLTIAAVWNIEQVTQVRFNDLEVNIY